MAQHHHEQLELINKTPLDFEAYRLLKSATNPNYEVMQKEAGEEIIFEPFIVEKYIDDIRPHFNSNLFGGITVDPESIATIYSEEIRDKKDFYGDFNPEHTVSYNFGSAIGNLSNEKTENSPGSPDIERNIDDIMENYSEFFYEDPKTMTMKKGAYDWLIYIEDQWPF